MAVLGHKLRRCTSARPDFSMALVDTGSDTNTNSFSISGLNGGAEDSYRGFAVSIAAYDGSVADGSLAFSSLQLNGNSLSDLGITQDDATGSGTTGAAQIWRINSLPTGTSLTLTGSITGFSGTMDLITVALYRMINGHAASSTYNFGGGASAWPSVTYGSSRFVIACGIGVSGAAGSLTGGGNPTDASVGSNISHFYDDAPLDSAVTYGVTGTADAGAIATFEVA